MGSVVETPNQLERWGQTKPRVLVAEDLKGLLTITATKLRARGMEVVPVATRSQALSVVGKHAFDVALLDINLAPEESEHGWASDTSGLDIARELRRLQPHAKIIGYSGKFRDGKLSTEDLDVFHYTFTKGALSQKDHRELWDLCERLGDASLRRLHEGLAAYLSGLRREYEAENPIDELTAEFVHETGSFPDLGSASDLRYAAEGELALASYEVRRLTLPLSTGVSRPVFVWQCIRKEQAKRPVVDLEVYGYPDLYASGRSERDAMQSLGSFVELVETDLDSMSELRGSDVALRDFIAYLSPA